MKHKRLVDVDMQSLVRFLLHVHCASNKSSGESAQMRSLVRALVPHIQNITIHGVCNECAVAISTFRRRWCFLVIVRSERKSKSKKADLKKMLVCRAPIYPPKTGPTPKNHCLSENLYFPFSFSRILLTNSSLKSVKAVFFN